jgi:HSP20 family protein
MANITRYEPFGELISMRREMDRLFDDFFTRPLSNGDGNWGTPLVDMFQTDNAIVVKATLPGVKAEDLDIQITEGALMLRAETHEESKEENAHYHLREQRYNSFARSLALPTKVKADKAEADLKDGLLTLTIPKAEEVKPKAIKVKAK